MPTSVTDQIFKLAEKAGLNPKWSDKPYRGVRDLYLASGHGVYPLGTIQVGVNSGRVLRAEIVYEPKRAVKYTGAVAVRAALKALAEERRDA